MKEVPKKHLPEVSGGQYEDGPCIPGMDLPGDYPRGPGNPYEVPPLDPAQSQN